MIATWIKLLSNPNETSFWEEKSNPDASFAKGYLWYILAAAVASIFTYFSSMVGLGGFQTQMQQILAAQGDIPPEASAMLQQISALMTPQNILAFTVISFLLSIVMFLVTTAIYHVIARIFGGQGSFGTFGYLSAAVWAPITLISSALGLVPFAGGCLSPLVSIYGIVLSYFAIKTNYELGDGKAIGVLITPLILVVALAFCAVFGLAGLIAAAGQQ